MQPTTKSATLFFIDIFFLAGIFLWMFRGEAIREFGVLQFIGMLAVILCVWYVLASHRTLLHIRADTCILDHFRSLAISFSVLTVAQIGYLSMLGTLSRYNSLMLTCLVYAFMLLAVYRLLLIVLIKHLLKYGYQHRSVLLVGNGRITRQIVDDVITWRNLGYRLCGILADQKTEEIPDAYYLGDFTRLRTLLRSALVDEVVIAMSLKYENKIREMVDICESEGVRVKIIPDFVYFKRHRIDLFSIGEVPLLSIRPEPLNQLKNRALKRVFDIVFSLVGIVVFSPLMILIALGIKLSSPGPVFFIQERVGINNLKFRMLKFRTMFMQSARKSDTLWTRKNDDRVTPLGRLLRMTSLDECPQLFNVLIGDMSLVGPRPEREHFVSQFQQDIPKYKVRHLVKSGITGWAQVNGYRGDTSISGRIHCDIYYLENWSFWLDLKILVLTIFSAKTYEGAY